MKNSRIHIVFATTLFAALLWVSLSMRESYQLQVSAPLVIESLPPGKAISSPVPRAVQLTFDEIGWKLAKLLWRTELKWVIDLNALPTPEHVLTLKDFGEQLGVRLGVQPTSMKPAAFTIALDTFVTKRVAVAPDIVLVFRDGYGQVGQTILKPDSVLLGGARSLLRKMDSWATTHQTISEVRTSIDVVVPLADSMAQFVTMTPGRVRLLVDVEQFAEKSFAAIPIELISVPQNREVILSSPRIDLVIRGGMKQLAGINQNSIRATVDYRVILADTSGIIAPEIAIPPGIQIVKRTPERLRYVVRKQS